MERELYDVLCAALDQTLPLELASVVAKKMKRESFKKGAVILRPGETSKRLYFIQRGLLRAYVIEDGVEMTMWMKVESEFVVSISSYYTQEPSIEFIHAIEDTEVFWIYYEDINQIYRKHLEFALIGLILTQPVLVEWNQRVLMLMKKDLDERFEWYMERHPELVNRVPIKYVASYLNMTPQSLYKVRDRYFKLT